VQLAQEIDLSNNRWDVGQCQLTCPLSKRGRVKNYVIVERNALVYCNLKSSQFAVRNSSAVCVLQFPINFLSIYFSKREFYACWTDV